MLISQTISKIPHLKDYFSNTNHDSNNEHTGTISKCRIHYTYEIKKQTQNCTQHSFKCIMKDIRVTSPIQTKDVNGVLLTYQVTDRLVRELRTLSARWGVSLYTPRSWRACSFSSLLSSDINTSLSSRADPTLKHSSVHASLILQHSQWSLKSGLHLNEAIYTNPCTLKLQLHACSLP